MDPNLSRTWLSKWYTAIDGDYRYYRVCDTAVGEDTAWLISPMLTGFYNGYLATGDANWVVREANWASAWIKRAVTEPDGYKGWPSYNSAGTSNDGNLNQYYADSMLGDAMCLAPIVELAKIILNTPSLDARWDANAKAWLALGNQMYAKWQSRGAWRNTAGGGAISVVDPYGIANPALPSSQWTWTSKWPLRADPNWGFSHPNNKANEIGMWLLGMYDSTGDANYKAQATKWYTLFKSRLTPQSNGTYAIWNYWQPAGAWDNDPNMKGIYDSNGAKHWIGVHPNNGYYVMDTESMVDAYEHGVVFTLSDIQRLVATNLAMVAVDPNLLWPALAPYNRTLQSVFESTQVPDSWGGYTTTPWYLAIQSQYATNVTGLSLWTLSSGTWGDPNCWWGGVPGGAQAMVGNGGTATISGGLARCSDFVLGPNRGESGTARMTSGRLEANRLTVGQSGTGSFTMSGGTAVIRYGLTIARDANSVGNWVQTDGNLVVPWITVGAGGSLTLSGGALRGDALDANRLTSVLNSGAVEFTAGTWWLAAIDPLDANALAGIVKIDAGATLRVGELTQKQVYVSGTLILDGSLLEDRASASPMVIAGDMTPAGEVPEPATLCLLGLGGLAVLRRRRNRRGGN
jgi:hypothetical protein